MVSAPRPEPGAETASVPDMTASLKAKVSGTPPRIVGSFLFDDIAPALARCTRRSAPILAVLDHTAHPRAPGSTTHTGIFDQTMGPRTSYWISHISMGACSRVERSLDPGGGRFSIGSGGLARRGGTHPRARGGRSVAAPGLHRVPPSHAVSDADQADPAKLARVYDAMADRFLTSGLNLDAITAVQQYYTGIERGGG